MFEIYKIVIEIDARIKNSLQRIAETFGLTTGKFIEAILELYVKAFERNDFSVFNNFTMNKEQFVITEQYDNNDKKDKGKPRK